MGGPAEASESQVLDRRAIRRWLPRVGVTLALLVVTPTCAVEAAYRIELLNVPRPVRPRRELAKMAAEALSLDLTGSPVAEIRPIWPWHVAGFLAVAFGNEFFPLGSRTSQQTLKSSSVQRARAVPTTTLVYDTLIAAGIPPDFYRRFALQMWISRNWTGAEALAAWADSNRMAERARLLYGKELSSLDAVELAGLVSFLRAPFRMRKSAGAWFAARRDLLQRMADTQLITESARAAADRLPLPAPPLTTPASDAVDGP